MTKDEFTTGLKAYSAHALAKTIASSIHEGNDEESEHRLLMIGELRKRLGSGRLALIAAHKELVSLQLTAKTK